MGASPVISAMESHAVSASCVVAHEHQRALVTREVGREPGPARCPGGSSARPRIKRPARRSRASACASATPAEVGHGRSRSFLTSKPRPPRTLDTVLGRVAALLLELRLRLAEGLEGLLRRRRLDALRSLRERLLRFRQGPFATSLLSHARVAAADAVCSKYPTSASVFTATWPVVIVDPDRRAACSSRRRSGRRCPSAPRA